MKPLNLFSRVALLFTVLILCGGTGPAQDRLEGKAPPAPTGLALEVDPKGGPVGHQSVPGSSFGGLYRRLPPEKLTAGSPQPHTFKLTDVIEGDAVRVKVFALMDRFYEQEILIGSYLLHEGEKAVVDQMAKFGYEPIEITVVKVKAAPSLLPTATSRIPSVDVNNVEARQGNFPTYRVTLHNLSYKDITYLEIQTFREGRVSGIMWPRGEQNRPLVKAGETYEVNVSGGSSGLKSPDGYTPSSPQRIEIITALFADKSYEGDTLSAARFIAELQGQKIQLTRALTLLEGASEAEGRAALENLERQVSALGRDAQPAMTEGLSADFPDLKPQAHQTLKAYIEGGLNQVRKELLKDIQGYVQARAGGATQSEPYGTWLSGLRQKYEAWLSRL